MTLGALFALPGVAMAGVLYPPAFAALTHWAEAAASVR